jgi:hypothetical protein
MTGSLLRALVMRNHWLLARPAARATGLAPPAGFRWFRAGCSWPFVERAFHAGQLVLGSSNSSRHWSRSALVSAGSALVALGPFLSALGARNRLVLGSPGTSRHCSRSALVFAVCACCTTQSPGGSSVGLAPRWSLPPTSPVLLSPPRARIPLEFSCSRQFHTRGCHSFDCPASQVKKTKVRPDYSSAPTQLALCLRLATT